VSNIDTLLRQGGFEKKFDRTIQLLTADGTPTGEPAPNGGEIITKPLAVKMNVSNESGVNFIDDVTVRGVIDKLCACAEEANKTCGLHVHLGQPASASNPRSKWTDAQVRTFFLIGLHLEDRLYNLCPASRYASQHAVPLKQRYTTSDVCKPNIVGEVSSNKYSNQKRYAWLNLIETVREGTTNTPNMAQSRALGTIEVRMLGNTSRAPYVWSWVRFWLKVAAYVSHFPTEQAFLKIVHGKELQEDLDYIKEIKEEPRNRRLLPPVCPVRPDYL
jgi:hypothetical protein